MPERVQNCPMPPSAEGQPHRSLPAALWAGGQRILRAAGAWSGLASLWGRFQTGRLSQGPPQGVSPLEWEVLCAERQLASRSSAQDIHIIHEVAIHNEYRLPDAFGHDDVVIDIGAHIGSFSYAALRRGCRHVHAFEADRSNSECAARNLKAFGQSVRVHHKAVWRSDRSGDVLYASGYCQGNSGGVNVFLSNSGAKVETISLDDLLRTATQKGRGRVRLMKIDCEGSEYPILFTSRLLHLVDAVCGEFHELNDGVYDHTPIPPLCRVGARESYTIGELVRFLEAVGFRVEWQRKGESSIGLFFATRAASFVGE